MKTENIGWIGTGIMGGSMCLHLLKAGHRVYVYNRTKEKTDRLTEQGATWCESPAKVAENCSRVFTMVGYPNDVRNVILGADGALAGMATGSILVDMTTSEPSPGPGDIYQGRTAKNFSPGCPGFRRRYRGPGRKIGDHGRW